MTTDGPNATICYGITSGNLGKDATVNVKTIDGSAVGKSVYWEGGGMLVCRMALVPLVLHTPHTYNVHTPHTPTHMHTHTTVH